MNIEVREIPRSLSKEPSVSVTFTSKQVKEFIAKRADVLEKSGIQV